MVRFCSVPPEYFPCSAPKIKVLLFIIVDNTGCHPMYNKNIYF